MIDNLPIRVYLAGPMRGKPYFNFPAFHAAEKKLRESGCIVFNPAKRDEQLYGPEIASTNPDGDLAQAREHFDFDHRAALCADLTWICQHADAIALLPGWKQSKGATAEHAVAKALGLSVIEL